VYLFGSIVVGAGGAGGLGIEPVVDPPPQAVNTKVNRIGIIYCTGAPVVIDIPIILL
jgi:hypothetical protein